MSALAIVEPTSTAEVCELLGADPWATKIVSGGTALVLMMRQGLLAPETLVALWRVPGLSGIEETGRSLRIGAVTTLAEVAASPAVRAAAPSLAYACSVVGNPRVRNVATIGGNLAEADYASDPPATLASLGARCHVTGPGGERVVPVADLITGFYETVLAHDELITHVEVPLATRPRGAVYLKYRSRSSEDRACVGVAARLDVVDGVIADVDVVVAAVASTLQRFPDVLAATVGRRPDAALAREVAARYAEAVDAMDDARGSAWYRRRMIDVFVRRAIEQAAADVRPANGGTRA
jgi:carbon-monoxide dehydrogenase medium subunit